MIIPFPENELNESTFDIRDQIQVFNSKGMERSADHYEYQRRIVTFMYSFSSTHMESTSSSQ